MVATAEAGDPVATTAVAAGSPVYIPETQTQRVESSHALRSGDPSVSAQEASRDPVDLLVAAAHASTDFSGTHEPAAAVRPREHVDIMEVYVRPLRTLLSNLHFSVDTSLSQYRQQLARARFANFQREVLDALRRTDSPDELKEFLDFCHDEVKNIQARGAEISNFSEVLKLLGNAQLTWSIAESDTQPRPPHIQIAAVETSIREVRGKLIHCRDAISTDEEHLRLLAQEEASTGADLAKREAQLSELEMVIRSLREKLASVREAKGATSTRVESNREAIAHAEQELKTLAAESQALRSTTVEAPAEAMERYTTTVDLMRTMHDDLLACIEKLGEPLP